MSYFDIEAFNKITSDPDLDVAISSVFTFRGERLTLEQIQFFLEDLDPNLELSDEQLDMYLYYLESLGEIDFVERAGDRHYFIHPESIFLINGVSIDCEGLDLLAAVATDCKPVCPSSPF